MSDEIKLIMALCDALNFDVVTTYDYDEMRVTSHEFAGSYRGVFSYNGRELKSNNGKYIIDVDGNYTSKLLEPIVNYELRAKRGGE